LKSSQGKDRGAIAGLRPQRRVKGAINGSLCKSITDSTHAEGGVALQGEESRYDNLEIGYDDNDDVDTTDRKTLQIFGAFNRNNPRNDGSHATAR